jgi:hypothetical protein
MTDGDCIGGFSKLCAPCCFVVHKCSCERPNFAIFEQLDMMLELGFFYYYFLSEGT